MILFYIVGLDNIYLAVHNGGGGRFSEGKLSQGKLSQEKPTIL